jgi:hypothetical protein
VDGCNFQFFFGIFPIDYYSAVFCHPFAVSAHHTIERVVCICDFGKWFREVIVFSPIFSVSLYDFEGKEDRFFPNALYIDIHFFHSPILSLVGYIRLE